LFADIHVEYGAALSELGQLVQMTWTTGFRFPVGAGIFCLHKLYRTEYRVTYFLSNVLLEIFREGRCGRSWSCTLTF